jgi:hypothetical protein
MPVKNPGLDAVTTSRQASTAEVTPAGTRGRLVVDESPDDGDDDDTLAVEHPVKRMAKPTAVRNNLDARLWSFVT